MWPFSVCCMPLTDKLEEIRQEVYWIGCLLLLNAGLIFERNRFISLQIRSMKCITVQPGGANEEGADTGFLGRASPRDVKHGPLGDVKQKNESTVSSGAVAQTMAGRLVSGLPLLSSLSLPSLCLSLSLSLSPLSVYLSIYLSLPPLFPPPFLV